MATRDEYVCEACGETFDSQQALEDHNREEHEGQT